MKRAKFIGGILLLCSVFFLITCSGGGGDSDGNSSSGGDTTKYKETIAPLTLLGYSGIESAVLNKPFVRQWSVTGGTPPYTWELVSGTLPPGLSLSNKGRITGTPTTTGTFTYTLRLSDSKNDSLEQSYTQTIAASGTINFVLLYPRVPEFGENRSVGFIPFAQGGVLPWTFTITGLPNGVTYDPATGLISGTPTSDFAGNITITLIDHDGNQASGSPVTVPFQINAPQPIGGGGVNLGCPSDYDGQYFGIFAYDYYTYDKDYNRIVNHGSFRVNVTLECYATGAGSTYLHITHASCTEPVFGCVMGCTPASISWAVMPATTPTGPFNQSLAGQGIDIEFPNGSSIWTNPLAGALSVTTGARILSNSLEFKDDAWGALGENHTPDRKSVV